VETAASSISNKGDLADVDDVGKLVRTFYAQVSNDDLLGPIFNDVAKVDWPDHLSKLTAFWSRALFGTSGYAGNPYQAHERINEKSPLSMDHFRRWLDLFEATVDAGWRGPNAEKVKTIANNVALVHSRQLVRGSVPMQTQYGDTQ
jgi:hemoglobin